MVVVNADPNDGTPPASDHVRCAVCAARSSCLLGQLPWPSQTQLAAVNQELVFKKGQQLQTEGVVAKSIRIIKLGTVMATRRGPDGTSRPVALIGRGYVLGQYSVFGRETQLGAVALSTGRLCEVRLTDLRRLQALDHPFMDALHQVMTSAFGRLADWAQIMRMRGLPRQLVATLLLLGAEQGNRVIRLPSHVALAALLSTSRESIARTLSHLEAAGHLRRIDRWHCELTPGHRTLFEDPSA